MICATQTDRQIALVQPVELVKRKLFTSVPHLQSAGWLQY